MPSGSRGGGSHRRSSRRIGRVGGSHFSTRRNISNSSNLSRNRIGGPIVFFYGGNTISNKGKKFGIIFILVLIAFFIALFCGISISNAKENIEFIKSDYSYYQNFIDRAEANGYIEDATITDIIYNEDANRYYFTYEIRYGYDNILEGYTFSVYTESEISNFKIGQIIKVAVESNDINQFTDSIPLDYKDMPIENDGEYSKEVRSKLINTIILSTGLIVIFVLIVIIAIKKSETQKVEENAGSNVNNNKTEKTVCEYCGSTISKQDDKCPNCGASTR